MNTPPRFFAAPPPSLPADKAAARTLMRGVRRRLKQEQPDAPAQAAHALAQWEGPVPSVAALYNAQGSEFDAWPLEAVLRGAGATIALPVAARADAPLLFRVAREDGLFANDAAGVPGPAVGASVRPDLIVLPLLAFDRFGGRLGQGGGYYDRTLAALRACGPPVTAFGLAYAGQEVDRAPTDAHDARLDGVLTERGLTLFNPDDLGDG